MLMQKIDWKQLTLFAGSTIADAMKVLNEIPTKVVLVVENNFKLLGTITDGDIRRGILKGHTIDAPVKMIMNCQPVTCVRSVNEYLKDDLIKSNKITVLPVLDSKGILLDIHTLDEVLSNKENKNPVIIMAGGKGERLFPLTKDTPKPLLKIGNKPILETILENLIRQGFSNFYFSVNYKASDIKKYFKSGGQWGVEIQYLEEKKYLGTAGCLALLEDNLALPLILVNGDLLTKIDFNALLSFHHEHKSTATVCVREYYYKVPYGVVELNGFEVSGIEEKPVQRLFVNAGIYILDRTCISLVPKNTYYDMPSLLKDLLIKKECVSSFPIHEYWIDVGHKEDFDKAQQEFNIHF